MSAPESPLPTSVSFTLTRQDLVDYNRTVISRVPSFQAIVWLRRLSLPVYALLAAVYFGAGWMAAADIALLTAAVWIPITVWTGKLRILRMSRSSPGLMKPQTIEIAPDQLRQKTEVADSMIDWTKIVDVMTTPSQVLFFLDRRYALIVPRAAFAYPSQGAAFAETARRWWSEARNRKPIGMESNG